MRCLIGLTLLLMHTPIVLADGVRIAENVDAYSDDRAILEQANLPLATQGRLDEMLKRLKESLNLAGGIRLETKIIDGGVHQIFYLYELSDNILMLKRNNCKAEGRMQFFVQFYPKHAQDRSHNFPWKGHHFNARRFRDEKDTCYALISLPTYPITHLQMGQLDVNRKVLWQTKLIVQ